MKARNQTHSIKFSKMEVALEEIHHHGFTHNDVRLDNVCFNDDYEAVLIDLDRCVLSSDPTPFLHGGSCMYNAPRDFSGPQLDWMQLGWMAPWVLDYTDTATHKSYHERTCNDLSEHICDDPFMQDLIQKGVSTLQVLKYMH